MKNVLVVVDMQKDFLLNNGSLNLGHDTAELRKRVADFVRDFDGDIYLTYDSHDETAVEFKSFPKHCVKGTEGAEICDEITEAAKGKQAFRIPKESYTADLISTVLDQNITEDTTLHVVGVVTHICVHDVVAALVNKTKNEKNFIPKIVIHRNMVDDFNPEMEKFALTRLQNLYGVVVQ